MRNLFGQVDGTVQPDVHGLDEALLWCGGDQPAWLREGSALVLRRIRMNLDTWDQVDRLSRENAIGRRLDTGAPVTAPRVPMRWPRRTSTPRTPWGSTSSTTAPTCDGPMRRPHTSASCAGLLLV